MPVERTIPTTQSADLATCTIKIEGEAIPADVQVTSVVIMKEINKIPLVRLKISDGDPSAETFVVSNGDKFIPGKNIEVMMGYHNDDISVFKGIITQHSNKITPQKSELMIECKDKAVKMTIARKNKNFSDTKVSDAAEEIIGTYGLEADVESSEIQHENIVQYEMTDWDFLVSRMDMIGKICLVSDGKVSFKQPDLQAESVLDVLFGATILEYRSDIDSRQQLKSVTATGWDYSSQALLEATAEEPSVAEEAGNMTATDLSDVLGVDDFKLINPSKIEQEELQARADAKLMRHRLSKVSGSVKFQGYPQLIPGSFIKLNGVGDRFNGPVFVNSIKHEFTGGDWTTEVGYGMNSEGFSPLKNASYENNSISKYYGLYTAVVTDNEDPLTENRVKIQIASVLGLVEVWARLSTLDAGKERGTFFHPEVGDEVTVGFEGGNPDYPIVIGMLHSSALPAPFTPSNSNDEKGYVSREKMKMIFNDAEKSLKIETPAGKKITISEQDALIKIEDENGNKITMDSSGITIEAAATLTLKGGSEVKISGPSVTVDGSGSTTIKGGVVQIN